MSGRPTPRGVKPATAYQHACLLSSFYTWALKEPEVSRHVRRNPAISKWPSRYSHQSRRTNIRPAPLAAIFEHLLIDNLVPDDLFS